MNLLLLAAGPPGAGGYPAGSFFGTMLFDVAQAAQALLQAFVAVQVDDVASG